MLATRSFQFLPTYDIDIAWSYKHKGFWRNAGGLAKSVLESEWDRINARLNVLFGSQQDPFDSYEWLHKLHGKYRLQPIYFFLVAAVNKGYDKNILPAHTSLQKLIKQHANKYQIGIHPSWQSGDLEALLTSEIATIATITNSQVVRSRQNMIYECVCQRLTIL